MNNERFVDFYTMFINLRCKILEIFFSKFNGSGIENIWKVSNRYWGYFSFSVWPSLLCVHELWKPAAPSILAKFFGTSQTHNVAYFITILKTYSLTRLVWGGTSRRRKWVSEGWRTQTESPHSAHRAIGSTTATDRISIKACHIMFVYMISN